MLYIIRFNGVMEAFYRDLAAVLNLYEILDPAEGPLTDEYLPRFCQGFKTGSHVDLISDDRVISMGFGSDIPNAHITGIYPNADR